MVKGVDVSSTQLKGKPYNSVLPFIRAKQAEKVEANKKQATNRAEKEKHYTEE